MPHLQPLYNKNKFWACALFSRGTHLWRQFVANGGLRWQTPFNANDPANTPHAFDTSDARVLTAFTKTVKDLAELNLPLDSECGDVHAG